MIAVVDLIFPIEKSKAVVGVIDQEYYKAGDSALEVKANFLTTQSFRPNQPKLDKISLNLRNTAGTINCGVSKYNGNDWDPVAFINDQVAVNGWNTFDFNDFDVTVGARYKIWLESTSDLTKWYYGSGNPYPNGTAAWGQFGVSQPDIDFQFRTYGYGPEVPAVVPVPAPAVVVQPKVELDQSAPKTLPVTSVDDTAIVPEDSQIITNSDNNKNPAEDSIKTDQKESASIGEPVDVPVLPIEKYSWVNIYTIIGSLAMVALLGLLIYLVMKRKKKEKQRQNN